MSFVFYDTETTGTNTAFDQILQFGAIKTDHELHELDRFEIRCRLLPYVVPSPGALRVTGITVDRIIDPELPSHYEMMRSIKAKLDEWSPAIFIGHNSMTFDEHLLRQALYKTLHAPYLTNTNGNSRSDSLRIMQAINLFQRDILSVPANAKGRPTFKLDILAAANGFDHVATGTAAHDAIGDVEATIHMCRILAEQAEGYWSNFVRFAQKAAVLDFAEEDEVFSLTDIFYGRVYSWMVTRLGPNPDNGSQLLVFNLAIDPDQLADLPDDELVDRLATTPKPVRALRANACPCVLSYEDTPEHLRSQAPDLADLRARAERIRGDDELVNRLIAAFLATREPREPSGHVEEQIYDGFTGDDDQTAMAAFHTAEWTARPEILARLSDARLQVLGERLIYAEAPEVMTASALNDHNIALARRLMAAEGTVPWLTLPKAIADTEDFLADAGGPEAALLRDLHEYLDQRAEEAGALIA